MADTPVPRGVIADDLTGATDLALMTSERGLRTALSVGPPETPVPGDVEASGPDVTVVALRSRTSPVDEAVAQSVRALRRLRAQGVGSFYFKYCSTFDSTTKGNIGPVLEALLDELGSDLTVVVPAFPAARRTVYKSRLFVGDDLLEESSMRAHPLTPMQDSHLVRLLQPQMRGRVGAITLEDVRGDLASALERCRQRGVRAAVLDAVADDDLETIARATSGLPLTTGSAGLAAAWGPGGPSAAVPVTAPGPSVSLVGSQSETSRAQVAHAAASQPVFVLEVPRDRQTVAETVTEVVHWCQARWRENAERPVLVHAPPPTRPPDPPQANLLEQTFGAIASELADRGVRRFAVGGGETSGSVVDALGIHMLDIGPPIATGVCWSVGRRDGDPVALALKSGNFGGPDFFRRAWELL